MIFIEMKIPKSNFSLLEFLVEKSSISRKPLNKKGKLTLVIHPSGTIVKSKDLFQLKLIVEASEDNDRFRANVTAIGIFSFKNIKDKSSLLTYFLINAPALIFPYVRSYISALTALSGMESINLPTIMIAGLHEELKANIEEID